MDRLLQKNAFAKEPKFKRFLSAHKGKAKPQLKIVQVPQLFGMGLAVSLFVLGTYLGMEDPG